MAFSCISNIFSRRSSKVTTSEKRDVSNQVETGDGQTVLHHHYHKHHHLHHHTISATVETAASGDVTTQGNWDPEYPRLTNDFYDDKGQVNTHPSPSTENEDVQARVFFRVINPLWRSYFSAVFEAQFRITGERVMLKMISKTRRNDKRQLTLTEQRVMAITQENPYPFIAALHSSFQTQKHCFLVMEFAGGGQLSKLLEHVGRFYESVATFYIGEIALGMFFLHQNRVLIRGLTTGNVLLGMDGHVRLCDFVWCAENVGPGDLINGVVGDFVNPPPEMLHDTFYTRAVDYWGLGIILYRMVMGKWPFSRKTRVELFKAITSEREAYDSTLQTETVDLCRRLLTKVQKERLGYTADAEERFKTHNFFDNLSWLNLEMRLYSPPYLPEEDDIDALTSQWHYLMDRDMLMKTSSQTGALTSERLSNVSSAELWKTSATRPMREYKAPRGSVESSSSLFFDKRQVRFRPKKSPISVAISEAAELEAEQKATGSRQGAQSELLERSESFENELDMNKRFANRETTAITAQERMGTRGFDEGGLYENQRVSKRLPPSTPGEDFPGPEDSGAVGSGQFPRNTVSLSAPTAYARAATRRGTCESLDLSRNPGWMRNRSLTRQDLVELAPEWEHWRNPRRSTASRSSKQWRRKKKKMCASCTCTPEGCKLCCRQFCASVRSYFAAKAARCRIICCGPEEIDYEPATDEKVTLSATARQSKDRSALVGSEYSVDVFSEINTAEVPDGSKPGQWIGLSTKDTKDTSRPPLSSRPTDGNPKEEQQTTKA